MSDAYTKGQVLIYRREGKKDYEVKCVGVHRDNHPDVFYTIKFADGREKQTEPKNLFPKQERDAKAKKDAFSKIPSASTFTRALSEWLPVDHAEPASLGSTMVGHCPSSFYDTQCVNQHGDTVLLCEDGLLRFHDLRSASEETVSIDESESTCHLLHLDESSLQTEENIHMATEMKLGASFAERKYRNVSFNNEGDMLLVWNESSVGIVAISAKAAPEGNLHPISVSENPCPFHLLGSSYMNSYKTINVKVVQAAFHPLSGYHVIMLLSNNLLLLVDCFSNIAQEFHLNTSAMNVVANTEMRKEEELKLRQQQQQHRNSTRASTPRTPSVHGNDNAFDQLNNHKYALKDNFIAFSMGGLYDWMSCTLFLLTREGTIFYLCPFLPNGSVLSTTLVQSLNEWCKDECAGIEGLGFKGDAIKKYLQLAFEDKNNKYLQDIKQQQSGGAGHDMNTTINIGLLEAKDVSIDIDQSPIKNLDSDFELNISPTKSIADMNTTQGNYPTMIKSKSYVVEMNDEQLWDEYKPLLQGPLRLSEVIEDRIVGKTENRRKRVRSNVMVCDICAPSIHRGHGAPVLVVSYEDGIVDFFVTAPECTERYIVPVFKAMILPSNDQHKGRDTDSMMQSMKYALLPEMVLNEEVVLRDSNAQYPSLDKDKDYKGYWKLTADPVFPYYFHVTHSTSSQSYLIFVMWLRSTMKKIDDILRRSRDENLEEEYNQLEHESKEALVGSHICPLRVPGISRATQIVPSINNIDSRNNDHLVYRHLVPREPLSSMTIVSDALLGHYAMFRRRSGQVEMINISAYMTLYLSRDQYLINNSNKTGKDGKHKDHNIYQNNYYLKSWDSKNIFEKRVEFLIRSIKEGLDTCPPSTIDKVEDNDAEALKTAQEKSKLKIKDHLTANVTVYLEDLALRTKSKQDSVRDLFDEHLDIIGLSNTSTNTTGMRDKLLYFQEVNQKSLKIRIERIGSKLLEQRLRLRALGEECSNIVKVKKRPSIQEKEFALRVEQWKSSVADMQATLTELSSAAKIASGEIIIQTSGKKVEKGSLLNKFGLDSPFMQRFSDTRNGFGMTQQLQHLENMGVTTTSNTSLTMTDTPYKNEGKDNDDTDMVTPLATRNEGSVGPDSGASGGSRSRKNVLTPLQRRRLNEKTTSGSRLAERMSSVQKKLQQQGTGHNTRMISSDTSTIVSPHRYPGNSDVTDYRVMTPLAKSTQQQLARGQTPTMHSRSNGPSLSAEEILEGESLLKEQMNELRGLEKVIQKLSNKI